MWDTVRQARMVSGIYHSMQILFEALILTGTGVFFGFLLAAFVTHMLGSLPLLGPLFEDTSGRSDIHLLVSFPALATSTLVLMGVGLISGLVPAIRAARLNPVQAMRNDEAAE